MATTVHLPEELLARVDRRARELGVSRNRFIVRALEKVVDEPTEWSPGFLEALADAAADADAGDAVVEMMRAIATGRTRNRPVEL